MAANISQAFPHVQCVVFDLPHIDIAASLPKSKRMNYFVGDMLMSIPFVDAILIKILFIGSHSILWRADVNANPDMISKQERPLV
ncbi:hypothetical protein ACB098_01G297800 [Castanea mollissima]